MPLFWGLLVSGAAGGGSAEGVKQESSDTFVIEKNATAIPYSEDEKGGNARRVRQFLDALPDGHKVRVKFITLAPGGSAITYVETLTPLNAKGEPDGTELQFCDWYRQPVQKVPYKNGQRHGSELVYRIAQEFNAQVNRLEEKWYVYMEVPWENGKVQGTKKTFHPNGKVASEATYVEGVIAGQSRTYDEEGRVLSVASYKKGKKHGDLTDYWPTNGNVKRVIPYRNGEVNGVAKEFYLSGKVKWERPFEDNVQHGIETHYEEDGAVVRTKYWLKGEEVPKEEFEKRFRR
jgi:antitoxin component YwqK of YwqJK toxin-antitoxin module